MKGANAEPSANTIRAANNNKNMKMGNNHHFLRIIKYFQISNTIDSLLIWNNLHKEFCD